MANNNIGAKIFSQSFNSRDIEATYNKIVSVISKETGKAEDEIKKEIDNLNFGEDLQKKIIEEFEKAEKKIGGKSFSFSKDLFKGLFDSKGSEEEINKVVKIFQSKINSMIEINVLRIGKGISVALKAVISVSLRTVDWSSSCSIYSVT